MWLKCLHQKYESVALSGSDFGWFLLMHGTRQKPNPANKFFPLRRQFLLRRGRRWCRIISHAIHKPDRLQNYIAADFQALHAQFVYRILGRVVKAVVVAVIKVNK